jgi:hypothetical protein
MSESVSEGQRRLATFAAVFWFEMIGALLVGSIVLFSYSPFFTCYGDPAPGNDPPPCSPGVSALLRDGSLALWALLLGATAAVSIVAWLASRHHATTRAVLFSLLGLIAATAVVVVAVAGGLVAVLPFLWVGIPAFLLLASWLPVLARDVGDWRSPGRRPT